MKKIKEIEPVVQMTTFTEKSYWDWKFPFYHKANPVLILFTKGAVYKYSENKGYTPIVRIKRRYSKLASQKPK